MSFKRFFKYKFDDFYEDTWWEIYCSIIANVFFLISCCHLFRKNQSQSNLTWLSCIHTIFPSLKQTQSHKKLSWNQKWMKTQQSPRNWASNEHKVNTSKTSELVVEKKSSSSNSKAISRVERLCKNIFRTNAFYFRSSSGADKKQKKKLFSLLFLFLLSFWIVKPVALRYCMT
jgi:hypothetical protein